MNGTYKTYVSKLSCNKRLEYRLNAIEISKRIEEHRLELARIVSKDKYLWDIVTELATVKKFGSLNRKEFKYLPKESYYHAKKVSNFFTDVERLFQYKLQQNGNLHIAKVNNVISKILDARDELVGSNEGLVKRVISESKRSFSVRDAYFDDMCQEAKVALIDAAQRYDYKLGFAFSTMAGIYIHSYIGNALAKEIGVHIPDNKFWTMLKVKQELDSWSHLRNMDDQIEHVAKELGMNVKEVNKCIKYHSAKRVISLSTPIKNSDFSENIFLEDMLEDPQSLDFENKILRDDSYKTMMDNTKRYISERDYNILRMRMEENLTYKQIGERFGLSKERIRQVLNNTGAAIYSSYVRNRKSA